MKILVTGSSGFVGQNLNPNLEQKGFNVIELSLRNGWEQRIPENYEAIIHLAGKAHDTKSTSGAHEYFEVNTELTKKLFNVFLTSNARDFIYFSSVKAVADTVGDILNEDVFPNPKTPYGQSKNEAEIYLNSFTLSLGKRLFILRPCMIHGPGNKGNLNLLYKVVNKGIPWPLANFENRRSFLSIGNLQFVINGILTNKNISSGTFNIADDEALSTNDLIKLIGEVAGKQTKLWKVPVKLIEGIAKIGDSLGLPLNSERLKKLTESYIVDNSKIKGALKIKTLPVSTRDGLEITLKSF